MKSGRPQGLSKLVLNVVACSTDLHNIFLLNASYFKYVYLVNSENKVISIWKQIMDISTSWEQNWVHIFLLWAKKCCKYIFVSNWFEDYLKLKVFFLPIFILTCEPKIAIIKKKTQSLTSLIFSNSHKKAFIQFITL